MDTNILKRWVVSTPDNRWRKAPRQVDHTDIDVNLQVTSTCEQVWAGFGGCFNELGWIALLKLDEASRRSVIQELFSPTTGCRFNFCRIPIGASDYAAEWYSLNEVDGDLEMKHFSIERDKQYLIPYIKLALAERPDMRFFASPWSPPTWMKFPQAYNYGTLIWEKEILEAYALYLLKFVRAYEKQGIHVNQIHVQNEPNSDQKFPSCKWTAGQICEFIREYLGPLFKRERVDCEIWPATIEYPDFDAWPNTIMQDVETRAYISGLGFQWAGKQVLALTHEVWPELPLLQTENECGDGQNSWKYAEYVFNLMRHYIGNGVIGYIYWNMVLETGGASTWGWRQNSMITIDTQEKQVIYNPEFYVMKHFSHFVEPQARRLELRGLWSGKSLAFQNPGGQKIVVIHNPFDEARSLALKDERGSFVICLDGHSFNTLVIEG
ncbi:MAG: glycoside hydrolase family 30 protein [Chloroflexota bacterium]|nr:glycoside hydrolase family 30 protein [Chloroflexota bacterium]